MLKDEIQKLSEAFFEETVARRRHLHENPELSFKEYNTSAFVKEQLSRLQVPFVPMADTGVVVAIQGQLPGSGQTIALRADMDALPIQEVETRTCRSKNDGVMHACGHDAHTASLLTTVQIVHALRAAISGTIKFIFQPAEERIPGGAKQMITEGVLDNPIPEFVIGQHVMPELEAGKVGFRCGKYMASSDELFIKITGKGGHAAMPHLTIDPVAIGCALITTLQQLVSRKASPLTPSVLSFGRFIANGSTNVIPDEVTIEGTFRTLDERWRCEAHDQMKKLALSLVEGMGGQCDFDLHKGYPVLVNEEGLTRQTRQLAVEYLGEEQVTDLDIWMAAEDFAYYSHRRPSCFYRLGTGNESRGITAGLHTPGFDIEESVLKTSPGLMAYMALKLLAHENEKQK